MMLDTTNLLKMNLENQYLNNYKEDSNLNNCLNEIYKLCNLLD